MTTADIEEAADPSSQLATADINLKLLLRHSVIPDFYETVGYPWWRRKFDSVNLAAAGTYVDTTAQDVGHIRTIKVGATLDPVEYIGDQDDKVFAGMIATTAAKPQQYWKKITTSGGNPVTRIYFQAPSDAAYTVYIAYDSHILFVDDTTSVNLSLYIPFQFHWALVEMLKCELYERRFGDGDPRYQRAEAKAGRLIAQAMENLEGGRGQKPKFIK